MNLPIERFQVGVQKYECHQFEQLLDDCLDGRDSLTELAANPHLQQCDECQNAYGVYRQFDAVGAAVLNGGAQTEGRSTKFRQDGRDRSDFWNAGIWSGVGAAALTTSAVLLLFVFASPPQGDDFNLVANNVGLPNASPMGLVEVENSATVENPRDLAQWSVGYISEFRSAIGDEAKPAFDMLLKSGDFSSSLVASQLAVPFQNVIPFGSLGRPWQYTSELPGIRPIHRSVTVGLTLCQDSVSLL